MKSKINLSSNIRLLRICVVLIFIVISPSMNFGQTIERKAVMVIDIQENLVNPNSKIHIDTLGIDLFFRNLNKNISQFNDNRDLVIYVVNEWKSPFINWATGNVCKKGGAGVGLDNRLILVNDKIYSKSKSNALTNKDLLKYLRDNKITDVYVMGLLAEGCVKATVKGLRKQKFNVFVIEDALGSKNIANKTKVINYFREIGIKTISTQEK